MYTIPKYTAGHHVYSKTHLKLTKKTPFKNTLADLKFFLFSEKIEFW